MNRSPLPVVVVGAGLAGLACAVRLAADGEPVLVLEAGDGVGGRVRTDEVDGFLLDRGFQVLLTAYPEARRVLDYDALDLRRFEPGALVRVDGSFHRVGDPFRRPATLPATLFSPVGSLADKLRILGLRRHATAGSLEDLVRRPAISTGHALRERGFSDSMIERFFRPFLGGVFLEPALETGSVKLDFVFRHFSRGDAVVPARGMGRIAEQLAARLPGDAVRTGERVEEVDDHGVTLASGRRLEARAVVLATESPEFARLTDAAAPPQNAVTCLYYACDEPPVRGPFLVLNGEGRGPVNNLTVMSEVSPELAPAGQALVSVSVLGPAGDPALESAVREQLGHWFDGVDGWRHLRTYSLLHALPRQDADAFAGLPAPAHLGGNRFACGDHLDVASLQGALASGRRAAEAVLAHLRD